MLDTMVNTNLQTVVGVQRILQSVSGRTLFLLSLHCFATVDDVFSLTTCPRALNKAGSQQFILVMEYAGALVST